MKEFQELLDIADTLHGPGGCPWDKEQTFRSLRPHLLEELHEVLEAVDENDPEKMIEELGDLLFIIIFYAKLGQKSGQFTIQDILKTVASKLIRRHPHVFGEVEVESAADVVHHWERIKKLEKKERRNALEGIPKTLNALARAQKIVDKMIRKNVEFPAAEEKKSQEAAIGDQFLDLVIQAQQEKVDAESALRTALRRFESILDSDATS